MKKFIASSLALLPGIMFAAPLGNIDDVATRAVSIGNLVVQLAIAFAVIWIIISIIRYLVAGGEEGRSKGGWAILYGVVALFVILSIWGLVYLLTNSFQFQGNDKGQVQRNIDSIELPKPKPAL